MRRLTGISLCFLASLLLSADASAQRRSRKTTKPPERKIQIGVLRSDAEPPPVVRGRASVRYSEQVISAEVVLPEVYRKGADHLNMEVSSRFYYRLDPAPETVRILFGHTSSKTMFARGPWLMVKSNRGWSRLGRLHRVVDKQPDGGVLEYLWIYIDYPIYKRIADGKEIKFQFGQVEVDLSENQLEALRDVYKALEAAKPNK
jgi:hypothetical protein